MNTMQDRPAQLRDLVFAAIDELNEQRPPRERLAKSLDTTLTGEDGALDSLGFVNFIVALERRLDAAFGVSISLLDDERLDPTAAQFRTVRAFIEFLDQTLPGIGDV
jgi:acyl carrier protein